MKKFTFLLVFISYFSFGQDQIPAQNGAIQINPILHGSLVIEYQDLTIYVDPYGGAERFAGQKPADLVLITDIHGDHHNQETLDGLDLSKATIVAPAAVAEKLPKDKYAKVEVIGNGEQKSISEADIRAIPMYNLPETADSRHPKGRGNGYIVTLGGKQIYLSGDTEDIPEMRALKGIDVAFVCMNLPYTMDVNQAASAVSAFKPAIVYPYHFRGGDGLADVNHFKSLVNQSAPQVEVRLRNWYPEN
ncbi:L-ascorbate metabolism protein UlaG, beta-lactamase superfamily [Algoriphagus faecimaris]|uniref:L-ascorbate metabolism protein UlaG, beta-lactamase superfamily n=1 Tax=Algoriphagus faecimaris TaxID=686796 RepID=A0A1G6QEW5_9BACT|nr:MBL fold metallo-hydrolase [Algoriphagus faecimaris]SDC91032.1 L-ascorbate metabolism protein UlaG, beta-lactamase superfamily [Algoriphagus faecimaris]